MHVPIVMELMSLSFLCVGAGLLFVHVPSHGAHVSHASVQVLVPTIMMLRPRFVAASKAATEEAAGVGLSPR
jgi:hypothetical protein